MTDRPSNAALAAVVVPLRRYGAGAEHAFGLCYWLDQQLWQEFKRFAGAGYDVVSWVHDTDPALRAFFREDSEAYLPGLEGPTPLRIEFAKAVLACIERELGRQQ